jgi:hypothetical protein
MAHSWWLFGFRKGSSEMFGRVSSVLKMVRFWNPNLFLGWSFWRFFKHPIFDNMLSELRWSDFDQLESSGRFLTWV